MCPGALSQPGPSMSFSKGAGLVDLILLCISVCKLVLSSEMPLETNQHRVSNPPRLELYYICEAPNVGAANQTQVLCKRSRYS